MSVINPESDVWEHIKIPPSYIAHNWPVRYAAISTDGRLVAVAGRRGLVHYSSTSGRWKVYTDKIQEQAFVVRGGMVWFHHVLIAAVEVGGSFQVSLSRVMDEISTIPLRYGFTHEISTSQRRISYLGKCSIRLSCCSRWLTTHFSSTLRITFCTIIWSFQRRRPSSFTCVAASILTE
jgi:hypothetical protein